MKAGRSSTRVFKAAVYGGLARVGHALASPARLELLDLLAQRPRTVEALAADAALPLPNASQHLQVLRRARLVEASRRGRFVEYRLTGPDVIAIVRAMRQLGDARLEEIGRARRALLGSEGTLEPLDARALRARLRSGDVLLMDVRPEEEYRAGHIPGAVSAPLSSLRRRLRDLPRDREIVAYCRGPYCVMAVDAVRLLRRRGFRARHCEDGVSEWRAHGFAVTLDEQSITL